MYILDGWRTQFYTKVLPKIFGHFWALRNFRFGLCYWMALWTHYTQGDGINHHQTSLKCFISQIDEKKCFVLECCSNFLDTFWHLKISDLDFVTEWFCEHSSIEGIAPSWSNFIKMLSWMDEEPCFILECCPNFLDTFWHLQISDFDFVTEWPCEHSTIEGIAPSWSNFIKMLSWMDEEPCFILECCHNFLDWIQ